MASRPHSTADRTPPARLAAFVSGRGRTLEHLAALIDAGALDAEIVLVVASKPCPAAEWARRRGVPTEIVAGDPPAPRVEALLRSASADWAVLAGYTRRLGIPASHAGRIVNIHPALLPSFGGPGMYGERVHRAVLEAGAAESGCTVHLCDEHYDTGPIILQKRCPVLPGDTAETLARRVFELELAAYPEALRRLIAEAAVGSTP